jgi:tetratricopeptide (TPR) repeat protein
MNTRSNAGRPGAAPLCVLLCALWLSGCATASHARGGELDKLSAEQLLAVATALEQNGDTVRAEQYLQQALRQGAAESAVVPRLLRMYAADGQYRLAIELAENHLRKHPRDRGVRLFLGTLYGALGQELNAVAQYERVLAQAPQDAQAHFAMASALHEAGRERGRADRHFRTYLELEPDGPHAEEARSLLLTELVDARALPGEAPAVPGPDAETRAPATSPDALAPDRPQPLRAPEPQQAAPVREERR